MRIKSIEYENFRNFKDHGIIKCSTDGKVTIIYGKNGDGKTTLHQLFQWVFYGQVNVRRHIVGGANRTLISAETPPRSCRIGTCRRLSAG